VEKLSRCHALVVECNHDLDCSGTVRIPFSLKQRIAGRFGHLDNRSAAALVRDLERSCLRHIIAAHLSEQNNTPSSRSSALAGASGATESWIGIATSRTASPGAMSD
jgi:phosphoribosyl 1,2-cyclic phosphodiesterase